jgi:hypothetical protein
MTFRKTLLGIVLFIVIAIPLGMVTRTMQAMSVIASNGGEVQVMGVFHKGGIATSVRGSLWATYLGLVQCIQVTLPDDERERQYIWNAIRQLNPVSALAVTGHLADEEMDRIFIQLTPHSLILTKCQLADDPFGQAWNSSTIQSVSLWNTARSETKLQGLNRMPKLRDLAIIGSDEVLVDAGFLNDMDQLQSLTLSKIRLPEREPLPALPRLAALRFRNCEIDLGDLGRFPSLTEITSDQAEELRSRYGESYPKVKICKHLE